MLLSYEEKHRFSEYLRSEVAANQGLVEQMKKLTGAMMAVVISAKQRDIALCTAMLHYINAGETVAID